MCSRLSHWNTVQNDFRQSLRRFRTAVVKPLTENGEEAGFEKGWEFPTEGDRAFYRAEYLEDRPGYSVEGEWRI